MSIRPLRSGEPNFIAISDRVNQLAQGRSNAVGTVTLSSTGATSTTVRAVACGDDAYVFLSPLTSAAAAAVTSCYIPSTDVTQRQFIVHHSSSTSTSRTFGWVALG